MADVAPSLDQLRAEIDRIDADLLRLLADRVQIGRRVAAAKGDATGPFLRPGREAAILRRLVEMRDGDLPAIVITRIWREILGANLARQVDPVTVVWDPSPEQSLIALAQGRGGVSTRVERVESAAAALDRAADGSCTLVVLPALDQKDWRWWPELLSTRTAEPRIIARLPFFKRTTGAIGVAAQDPDPSGDDITLFAMPGDPTDQRTAVGADMIDTAEGPDGKPWSLVAVSGYHADGHMGAGAVRLGVHARPYPL